MRTKRALKSNRAVRATIPYESAQRVGVLFTVEDEQKHQLIKSFIERLTRDGKQVQVLEYLPKKKDNPEFKFDFFTIENLSFWGKVNSDHVEKFAKANFDYLFNIDIETNPLIQYVLANCKAHCRVGRFNEYETQFYELMIETKGSVQGLIDNMYSYTKKLR